MLFKLHCLLEVNKIYHHEGFVILDQFNTFEEGYKSFMSHKEGLKPGDYLELDFQSDDYEDGRDQIFLRYTEPHPPYTDFPF